MGMLPPRWSLRPTRRMIRIAGGTLGTAFSATMVYDHFNGSVIRRGLRALWGGVQVAYMYKTTTPANMEEFDAMNQRAADILLRVCQRNEGLFVKMGQGLSSLNQVLPPQYTETLKALLDNAPPVPLDEIRRTIREELGADPEDIFDFFDPVAIASASIAQVHRGRIRAADGTCRDVAVKVQKPLIRKQVWWDLWCYRIICQALETLFGLPLTFSAEYIADGFIREQDFRLEAQVMSAVRSYLLEEQKRQDVYIPEVVMDLLRPRVMVTEWIEADKLVNVERIDARYDVKSAMTTIMEVFSDMIFDLGIVHCDPHPANVLLRRRPAKYGAAMTTAAVDASVSECRCLADEQQVVLLDFGLSITEPNTFRRNYARLFRALFTQDFATLESIVSSWGIADADLFASMQLMKPFSSSPTAGAKGTAASSGGGSTPPSPGNAFSVPVNLSTSQRISRDEMIAFQTRLKHRITTLLRDEEKVPRELVLVGRSMNILRSLNRSLGVPVNRAAIFARRAVAAIAKEAASGEVPDCGFGLAQEGLPSSAKDASLLGVPVRWVRAKRYELTFELTIALINVVHYYHVWLTWFMRWWASWWSATAPVVRTIEDLAEDAERRAMKAHFGFPVGTTSAAMR